MSLSTNEKATLEIVANAINVVQEKLRRDLKAAKSSLIRVLGNEIRDQRDATNDRHDATEKRLRDIELQLAAITGELRGLYRSQPNQTEN